MKAVARVGDELAHGGRIHELSGQVSATREIFFVTARPPSPRDDTRPTDSIG